MQNRVTSERNKSASITLPMAQHGNTIDLPAQPVLIQPALEPVKIFHFIWVGCDIPEKYVLNLKAAITFAEGLGYAVHLWIDTPQHFYNTMARKGINFYNRLHLREINELTDSIENNFNESGYAKKIMSRIQQEMIGNKNCAAVADWLRLLILLKEGGIYSDIDHQYLKCYGIEIHFLSALPEGNDIRNYKNKGIIIDDNFYWYNVKDDIQNWVKFPVINSSIIKELIDKNANNKLFITSHQFYQCIGLTCPVINNIFKVDWDNFSFFQPHRKLTEQQAAFLNAVERLPHGIKILSEYSLDPACPALRIQDLASGVVNKMWVDNSFIVSSPGQEVLKKIIIQYSDNYDDMEKSIDTPLSFVRESKPEDINSIKYSQHKSDIESLKPQQQIEVIHKNNYEVLFKKTSHGHLLLYKQTNTMHSDLAVKRSFDTLTYGNSFNRKTLCLSKHGSKTLLNTLEAEYPEAFLSDLFVTAEQLSQINLAWDNNWLGDPDIAKKPAFEEQDAISANLFGRKK